MFNKAERKKLKLRLALAGVSGSGKTYSALQLAQGLGERIAVIDTEHGSASLYSDLCEFDVATLSPPYTPQRYIELIKAASKDYDVLIIDSLSHAWMGDGGVLTMHDNAQRAQRGGNSFTAWREVTPQHNALVEAILNADCHIICTMRSKTAYEIVENDKGKKEPRKLGLAPQQRDGFEYEFTTVLDLSVEGHMFTASKDRTRVFEGQHGVLTPEHGVMMKVWLDSGNDETINAKQLAFFVRAVELFGGERMLTTEYGIDEIAKLPAKKYSDAKSRILDYGVDHVKSYVIGAESVESLQTINDALKALDSTKHENAAALRELYANKMRELAKDHQAAEVAA